MTFEILLATGVILLYALATLAIFMGTLSMRRKVKIAANWITLAGFGLHTLLSITVLVTHSYAELSAGYLLQLFSWCVILTYLIAWRWLKLPFLAITAAPLAFLLFILATRLANVHGVLPAHLAGLFMWLHLCSLFISVGLLAMAFGAGLLFIYVEGRIKTKMPIAEFARDLPSLSTFDKVNQIAVMLGFPLYTLGLMSGFIWVPEVQSSVENPKVLLSMFIWLLYALLFYQRMALGYRGRKTAMLAILIFSVSAASIGVDYLFATHHSQLLQPLL